MSSESSNTHIIITGGSRGIGRAVAEQFAAKGNVISILGLDANRITKTASEISKQHGVMCDGVQCDVRDDTQVKNVIAQQIKKYGVPSVLINNAGGVESAPFLKMDAQFFDRMISLNLKSVFSVTHAVLPHMIKAKSGSIVNVASTAGLEGGAYITAYSAAKHGVVGFTKSLAIELNGTGVSVSAICPGFVDTDLFINSAKIVAEKTGRDIGEVKKDFVHATGQTEPLSPKVVAAKILELADLHVAANGKIVEIR